MADAKSSWEHARVTFSSDRSIVWGHVVTWAADVTKHEDLHGYEDRDAAICRLGTDGFELVTVTVDPENDDGVTSDNLWFRRRLLSKSEVDEDDNVLPLASFQAQE